MNTEVSSSRMKVAVLGATGMVGRRLVELLIGHPEFEVHMLVGSEESVGLPYRTVWEKKERDLEDHYGSHFWRPYPFPELLNNPRVASFQDLLRSGIGLVFSSVPDRAGYFEEQLLASGRLVFSNSPYRRFDSDVALIVAEVNGNEIKGRRLVKNPNCVTSGLALVLEPIRASYGIEAVVVTTYQAISGRGDAKYASDLVLGNVYPLHGSEERTEEYIGREVRRIFGNSFASSITCNRTCVQDGHFVEVRIKTSKPVKKIKEVSETLAAFNPLKGRGLHNSPDGPIIVLQEKGRPRPMQDAWHHRGMAIAVGNLAGEDGIFDLRLTYVVNNLIRGAAGGALLNAELWLHQQSPCCAYLEKAIPCVAPLVIENTHLGTNPIIRLFDLVDSRDWQNLNQVFCEDITYERPGYEPLVGFERVSRFYREERAIASGKHHLENVVLNEDSGACWGRFVGVHKNNSAIDERFADVYRFKDGKIKNRQSYFFRPAV
jgi:aspartate-semialdehyde dehydrogenase